METLRATRWPLASCHVGLIVLLAGCAPGQPVTIAPAIADPPADASEIVVSGERSASEAGLAMLARGGAPVDAAVAAQAVLGLVEPQHSGFGGGSVLLTWQAADGRLLVFDGTPRAGRNALPGLNVDHAGRPLDPALVVHGGGAVGVPGTLPALAAAHAAQGKLPWGDLFAPAIKLAEDGFAMPRALHDLLAAPGAAKSYAEVAALYLTPEGTLPEIGATLHNPAYAATLRRVAKLGPAGLYDGDALPEIMAALGRGAQPSRLTADDLRDYKAVQSPPLCAAWREWKLCTAPPPAFGGLVALQVLGMAGAGDFDQPDFVHRFLEAGRLAQADRRRYVADPDFVPVPTAGLLDSTYLVARAGQIRPAHALAHPKPGEPQAADAARPDPGAPTTATSQLVVVDRAGNALTMTSSLTHLFGARVVAGGMVLNNALANFAPLPPSGASYANQMAPGKRPANPVAPVLVLDRDGRPLLLGGSGGGPGLPDFVAAALIEILANHRAPAAALARPHVTSADPDHVVLEAGTSAEALLPALTAMGHQVRAEPLPSGSAFVMRTGSGWVGAADPRREGAAVGN